MENNPVGESQSNGEVERAVRGIQGQTRTMRGALEEKYKVDVIIVVAFHKNKNENFTQYGFDIALNAQRWEIHGITRFFYFHIIFSFGVIILFSKISCLP